MAPVHKAAQLNAVQVLIRLLDDEPDLVHAWHDLPSWSLGKGQPLHFASFSASVQATQLLLDRGAVINARAGEGSTPLVVACIFGSAATVPLLLARGADPTMVGSNGMTVLMLLARERLADRYSIFSRVAAIRLLLEDGRVPVDAEDSKGRTALWHACKAGQVDVARVLLLEGRADHTIADNEGRRPADLKGNVFIARLIKWYEYELNLERALSKARAVVDATVSITKAPVKVGAKTEAAAQTAREEAAPAYLRGRVAKGEALPSVQVVGQADGEEERRAVCEFVIRWLKDDLYVELMEGLRYRRRVANESEQPDGGEEVGKEETEHHHSDHYNYHTYNSYYFYHMPQQQQHQQQPRQEQAQQPQPEQQQHTPTPMQQQPQQHPQQQLQQLLQQLQQLQQQVQQLQQRKPRTQPQQQPQPQQQQQQAPPQQPQQQHQPQQQQPRRRGAEGIVSLELGLTLRQCLIGILTVTALLVALLVTNLERDTR